ncbi:PspC domain-containing protein [Goodfellowiella coeruleoviolacea]|uniref:Phage shock protein C (PspC) family protein n=1 Tax=Goodfellowiella coeruleoviolacea TaxID=334858 RepID=A0AAE3KFE5_9PSEU|nr:PspC domain-containing protein [Goodfellowiella coeruleoviolacea]MCP2164870.1 phage shock protein C (PspC) family protein [Goodfellowiella coeruleoviolacea]
MTNNVVNEVTGKVKKFRRSRTERMLAGVCGGAARLFGIDAAILRVVLVAATLFGFGTGALLYLICWIVVPEEA